MLHRLDPSPLFEQGGAIGEIADSGEDQAIICRQIIRARHQARFNAQNLQGTQHRAQIADAIIDNAYFHGLSRLSLVKFPCRSFTNWPEASRLKMRLLVNLSHTDLNSKSKVRRRG